MDLFKLIIACRENNYKEVESILKNGFDIDLNKNQDYAMPPGFIISLPLVEASINKAKECVKILVEHGANPDAICSKRNKSAREISPELF